jgi:flap endonuclease-1
MGISNLVQLFDNCKKEVTLKDLENLTIAIDVSNEVYRSILAMKSVTSLTDKDGKTTSHINTFLANIQAYKKHNIKPIYVFDNCPYKEKNKTLELRKEKKDIAKEKINNEQQSKSKSVVKDEHGNIIPDLEPSGSAPDEIVQTNSYLEKQAFTPSKEIYNDIIMLLEGFGLPYVIGPNETCYEAEQYGAFLTQTGRADIVLTSDADAFMFGAKKILRKESTTNKNGKKVTKLFLYDMEKCQYKLDDIINIGISLGTDFCHGTPKIGIKTALKKLDKLESLFDEEQKIAKNIFKIQMNEFQPVLVSQDLVKLNQFLADKSFKKVIT